MTPQPKASPPLIIAHRGFRIRYPENTLAAFRAAVAAGAPMIELDVRLSSDRQLVVIHDADLARTTNGQGLVRDHTAAQLMRMDAGGWFDPKFRGERIPTLKAVFEALPPDLGINVEIKPDIWEPHRPADAVEPQVLDLVRSLKRLDTVLISSFEPRILESLRSLDEAIRLAYLTNGPMDQAIADRCRDLGCYSCHPKVGIVDQSGVDLMHAAGILVFSFTVNAIVDYRRLLAMGVDGVITDDPLTLLNA